ncbi:MAG TPA: hypothetical protein VGB84_00090 [Arachidicoccus sp.]
MKTFQFNIQSKGGAGKSMLTYLQALKEQANKRAYFVDFDSSVKSSYQQLKFLQGQTPPRFAVMSLLDAREKLDRQLLFQNLLELSQKDYDVFYLDFGAPESDQLPSLFSNDYTVEEFKMIEQELNAEFIFNVVVAGGGAYNASTQFLQKITELINGFFPIRIFLNENSFNGNQQLINELKVFASVNAGKINEVKLFGNFDTTAAPHKSILQKIGEGRGMEAYAFIERIKILKEIVKV